MPGGLVLSSGQDDVMWSGHASPSGDHRKVIWRSECMQMYSQASMQAWKIQNVYVPGSLDQE